MDPTNKTRTYVPPISPKELPVEDAEFLDFASPAANAIVTYLVTWCRFAGANAWWDFEIERILSGAGSSRAMYALTWHDRFLAKIAKLRYYYTAKPHRRYIMSGLRVLKRENFITYEIRDGETFVVITPKLIDHLAECRRWYDMARSSRQSGDEPR